MSTEPENRLIEEPEFRELIQTAQTIDVEDAWLDAQLDQILEKIGPPSPPGGSHTGSGGGTGNLTLNAVKFFAPLIIGLGIYLTLTSKPTENKTTLNRIEDDKAQTESIQNETFPPRTASSNSGPNTPPKVSKKVQTPARQDTPTQADVDVQRTFQVGPGPGRAEAPPERSEPDLPTPEIVDRRPMQRAKKVPTAQVRDILEIIDTAQSKAASGYIDEALELLEPLLTTRYRPEVLRVQAELAYQHERYDVAVESLRAILKEPNHDQNSKRSFLRRMGDALAKYGSCGQALLTYQKALKLNPDAEESAAIRAAIVRCQ